jgi:hypothetical protein
MVSVYARPGPARPPAAAPDIRAMRPGSQSVFQLCLSTMMLKSQFSALAQTHPGQKRSLPWLERTLENCTLENCTLENCTLETHPGELHPGFRAVARTHPRELHPGDAPWRAAPWRRTLETHPGDAPWRAAPWRRTLESCTLDFVPWLERTLENCTLDFVPWLERTLENCTLENVPRLQRSLENCTLENVPRLERTLENVYVYAPGSRGLSCRGSNAPWRMSSPDAP